MICDINGFDFGYIKNMKIMVDKISDMKMIIVLKFEKDLIFLNVIDLYDRKIWSKVIFM